LLPPHNRAERTNTSLTAAPQLLHRHNFDGQVNWNRTAKHQIWGKFSNMRANVTGSFSLNQAGGVCLCEGGNGTGDTKVYLATLGQTYTVSSNFIIDGVFGF